MMDYHGLSWDYYGLTWFDHVWLKKTLTARALGNSGMLLLQTNIYIIIYIYIFLDKPSNTDFERQRWLPLKYKTEYRHVFRRFLFFLVYQQPSNWRSSSRTIIRMCFLCYAPKLPGDEVPINIACCFTQLHKQIAVYSLFFSIELALAAGIRRPRRHPRRRLSFMTKMRPSVGASCWRWCSTEMDEVDQYSNIIQYPSICQHLCSFSRYLGDFWEATMITHSQQKPDTAWTTLHIIG